MRPTCRPHASAMVSARESEQRPRAAQCAACGGSELYTLSRSIDGEPISLQLCRVCHAQASLVVAIDELMVEMFAESTEPVSSRRADLRAEAPLRLRAIS